MTTNSTVDFNAQAASLMQSSTRSIELARRNSAAIVAAILASDNSEAAMMAFFEGARGHYLKMRRDGAKEKATVQGKAWKILHDAAEYHFGKAGFKAVWPNWASGDGPCTLATKADATAAAKSAAAARAERDSEQLARADAEQATAELSALREMGPSDMALSLALTLTQWTDNPDMVRRALIELVAVYGYTLADTGVVASPATDTAVSAIA